MPVTLTSTNPLKQRLLTGTSAAVIVLALAVAVPSGAMAQTELVDGTPITADAAAGVVESDAVAPVTVAINTNDGDDAAANTSAVIFGAAGGNSILNSTDQAVTFNVSDSAATAVGYLVLDDAVSVTGGGSIAINLGGANSSGIVFNGDVLETDGTITITVGENNTDVDTFDLVFATDQNRDLTIDAAISAVGDDNIVLRIVDTELTAANTITFTDSVNIGTDAGDLIIVDSNLAEGAAGGDDNGDYDIPANVITAVFQDDVTSGEIQVDSTNGGGALVLGADGVETTVTADIDSTGSTNGTLSIADGADVTIVGDINSTTNWSAPITIGGGSETTLTLQGNTSAGAALELSNNATLVVDATGFARTIGDTVDAAGADINTMLQTTGDSLVTFQAAIGDTQPISLIDLDTAATFSASVSGVDFDIDANTTAEGNLTATGDVDVADTFTLTLNGTTNAIAGDLTGGGTVVAVGDDLNLGTAGQTSTVSVANINGPGDINITDGANVVISSIIGAGAAVDVFDMLGGVDTVVTFNSMAAVSVIATTLEASGSTIILGSNIGNGDTVFQADPNLALGVTSAVQVSAAFNAGDVITLVNGTVDVQNTIDGNPAAGGEFTVTDTALMDFTLAQGGDSTEIAITGVATTSAQAAATLGVSTGEADALRQAVTSATNAPDAEGLDALTAALNAGGTQATQAAQQVGPQGTTLGGGAQTAFGLMGEQQSVTGNRLAGFRSGDPRFVSAFAATETGISGGDLDGPYAPLAPRYTNSVWFQAFGGVADADGDATGAGYDAGFGGAMIGIDGAINDNVTVGAFGSYTYSSVVGDGAGNAQLDANTYAIGVYAGYTGQSFYLDAFASYAGSDNDVSRTAFAQTITASYDASQFAVGLAGGVPIEVSSNVFITPNASLTYNHYEADSYTETGSAGFSARVNPGSASQLAGTLGARVHAVYEQADGTRLIPELRVGIIGDLIDDDAVSTATFVGGGTTFNVTGADTDDIGALIGLGLAMENDAWSAGISYDADLRGDYMSHTGHAEFRWKF